MVPKPSPPDTRRVTYRVVLVSLLVWPIALWIAARDFPPWGDEIHFLDTVRMFGAGVSLDLLRRYPEMSGPLPFLTYGAWGHLVGFSTAALRLLTPFIAWAVTSLWFLFFMRHLRSPIASIVGVAILVLNPYFLGLSVFVFTDMLALLGLVMVAFGIQSRRAWMVAAGIAVATCSRQYLAFLAPAVIVAAWLVRSGAPRWRLGTAAFVGMLPLGALIWLWEGGLAPVNSLREVFLSERVHFNPHALSLYIAAPGAYLAPLVIPAAWKAGLRVWAVATVGALLVWLAPIQPSIVQTRMGIATVGFMHRAAVALLPPGMVNVVFMAFAVVTLAAVLSAGGQIVKEWRTGTLLPIDGFLWAAAICFLLLMPFSYMPWEKYALPLFMILSALLVKTLFRGSISRAV